MRSTNVTWTAVVLIFLTACAQDDVGEDLPNAGGFSERDSAGVRIVESSSRVLVDPLPWAMDTVPNLVLGDGLGDGFLVFDDINGIVALPDGGLIVLDGGSGELRWFDAADEHIRTGGGAGQGPGEFLNPILVPQFEADSLLIFDRARRAFTWVAPDGSGVRAMRPGGPLFAGTPSAAVGSRALFRSASFASQTCPENDGCEIPVLLRSVDVGGTLADTLAVYPSLMMRYTQSGPPVLLTGPLDQRGAAAAAPDGPVIEGDPRFELRQFDRDGRLAAIFRVDATSRGTPQDALERYVQEFPNPEELRSIYEMMGLPTALPAFETLRVDHLGWYWAKLFRVGRHPSAEWLVFDPNGQARGVVEQPSGLEVHEIGRNYILGRWVDDLGVESVRRYAIDRRGG